MFRTSKILIAGALVAFAGSAVNAQSANQEDLLSGLLASATSGDASEAKAASDELRAAITAKIMDLATTSQRISRDGGAVTIQQLDELNRTAERAKTELELERLEVERMKAEIESLLALYEAVQTLEGEKNTPPSFEQQMMQQEQVQQEVRAANEPTDWDIENENLPRVVGIMGVSGNFEASLAMPDGSRAQVTEGSYLDTGFDIVEVGDGYVLLKGHATGSEYRLAPKGEPRPRSNDGMMGQGGPNEATNLNGMPIGIF